MKHLGRWLILAYLGAFTLFVRDPSDAREERRLLLGSLDYDYRGRRAAGRAPLVAALLALWTHVGELQPSAVLARLRTANQRAARAGVGGRRVALRLLALLAVAASAALWIWGVGALGWVFLGFAVFMLALMLWSARHSGTRWLIPLISLLMIWPVVEMRSRPGQAFLETINVCALLALTLGAHQLWRWGRGDAARWRGLAVLATVPLWWTLATAVHSAAYRLTFPDGYGGPTSARFGLPADDTLLVVGLAFFWLVALYWLALALIVGRVASCYRVVPDTDDSREVV